MSIDYANLSGLEVFPLNPNWDSNPSIKFTFEKQIIGYPGTSQDLLNMISKVPKTISMEILLHNKEIEKIMFDFFADRKGRWGRFWLKYPLNNYTLYSDVYGGSSFMRIKSTSFDEFYTGNERIFLDHANGNQCIRKVTVVDKIEVPNEYLQLTFDTPLVDDWLAGTSQINMGLALLVRFDKDDLAVTYVTDKVATVSVKMMELIYDYSEV